MPVQAGAKKVQQQLSLPGELERFISSPAEVKALRACFAGLWSLSGPDEAPRCARDAPVIRARCARDAAIRLSYPCPEQADAAATDEERDAAEAMAAARAEPGGFVMKPQREGGGHNLFGNEIAEALKSLSRAQARRPAPPAAAVARRCRGELLSLWRSGTRTS